MMDRILGLVGGIGPESTIDYYRRLVNTWHARTGHGSHPRVLINSIDSVPLIGPLVAGDLEPMRVAITDAVQRLAAAGAGMAMIGSVASHAVFTSVAAVSPVPMLSIVRATSRAAQERSIRRPALFGTLIAVEGAYFAQPFDAAGIDLVRPEPADRRWIHDIYLGELVRGVFADATRARALEILARLRQERGVDGLILGGTELSLLLPAESYDGIPVLNAAAIHVDEAVAWLAGGDAPSPEG